MTATQPFPALKNAPLSATAFEAAILGSINFSSIATDTAGLIKIINVGAQHLLGYTAEDAIDHLTVMQLCDERQLAARAEALSLELGIPIAPGLEALTHKASRGIDDVFELSWMRGDGVRLPVRVSVTALKRPQGDTIGFLLIVTDNTVQQEIDSTRNRYERALQLKNAELEEASKTKSEFLANMSHELRTPLNAIIGFSEVLRDGLLGIMPDKQRVCIDDIFSSGQHLLSLINDILDLSKVEAGKMALDLETVKIGSLFVNSLSIVREKAAERNIRLNIDVPDDLGSIAVDARKVKQILYNLLSNAVKFSREGGAVTLHARRVKREDVGRLSGPWAGRALPLPENTFAEFLRITVSDSGIGIPVAALEQLFAPFSQIDSGLARRFEGTGLGLAMIRALAELHGGTAAVESAPGQGSSFTVWLPARESILVRPPPVLLPRVTEPSGKWFALVGEDEPKAAALIRVQLESAGFQVVQAASAEEALAIAIKEPLCLITLDIMLPDMDGWEFLARIKQIPTLSQVPLVIISIVADRNKGIALGASAVLQKPVSRQDLLQALVQLNLFPRSSGKTLKVLVVDNDPKAVELIASRFVGLASTTLRAYGGREAIETTRSELPDLIVLDLLMPEVTGFDVVEAIKDDPRTATIPILVVTSFALKPGDREKLNSRVMAILDRADFDQRFITEVHRAIASRAAQV